MVGFWIDWFVSCCFFKMMFAGNLGNFNGVCYMTGCFVSFCFVLLFVGEVLIFSQNSGAFIFGQFYSLTGCFVSFCFVLLFVGEVLIFSQNSGPFIFVQFYSFRCFLLFILSRTHFLITNSIPISWQLISFIWASCLFLVFVFFIFGKYHLYTWGGLSFPATLEIYCFLRIF